MKQGWELKTIGDVCVSASSNVSQNKLANDEGDYPIFGASGLIKKVSFYHRDQPYLSIVKDGSGVGRVTKMDAYTSIIGTLQYIIPKENIDLDYLNYSLMSVDFKKYVAGAAIPHIYFKDYKNEPFLWMPLPEQQRIVSILDEVFSAIERSRNNAEQNLKNAKELFESYLQGVFENGNENWEVNCLDELGTITSSKRIYKSEYVKEGVPFYRTKEIKELSNGKAITLELFISRQRYEQIKQSFGVPKIGDLLMSAVGTIGEIMVIENEDEFYFKDGNIVWFKDFEKLDTNYLKYALTAFVEKIKSLAIGAAYSALTIEKLNKYQIAFPINIEDQQTIVRQLDSLRAETQKLEAVYQKKIADLGELKKSILQKAFAGELTNQSYMLENSL
jgi:type I restriction enzyme S subunit